MKKMTSWLLLCLLTPLFAYAEVAVFDIDDFRNAVVGQVLKEANSGSVQVRAYSGVEVNWYAGPAPETYSADSVVPAGNILLKSEFLDTPDLVEGDDGFYFSDLAGIEMPDTDTIWVGAFNESGGSFHVFHLEGRFLDAPSNVTLHRIAQLYAKGANLGYFEIAPYVTAESQTAINVEFYKGNTGDTSELIYEAKSGLSASNIQKVTLGGGSTVETVFFNLEETTSIWARVRNSSGFVDTSSQIATVYDADDVKIINWDGHIDGFDQGNLQVTIGVELDTQITGTTVDWYYGKSGDTSTPAVSLGGPSSDRYSLNFDFKVPEDPFEIWARVKVGDYFIDSPTTLIDPLDPEIPSFLDQPDDVLFGANSYTVYLYAVGGDLNFQWYAGESGDVSTPVNSLRAPILINDRYSFLIDSGQEDSIWVRVSNHKGYADSRTVHIVPASMDRLMVLNMPELVRIHENDFSQGRTYEGYFPFFQIEVIGVFDRIELWEENNNSSRKVAEEGYSHWLHFGHEVAFQPNGILELARSLRSGKYFYRIYLGDDYIETTRFTYINELLDTTVVCKRPLAYTLLPANSYTNGGVFKATLFVNRFVANESVKLYAGLLGDRSKPLLFKQKFKDNYLPDDAYGYYDLEFEWPADESEVYWFEAETYSGESVQAVLRYPYNSTNFATYLTIQVAPGADFIPIPHFSGGFPDVPTWVLSDDSDGGDVIELPLDFTDFKSGISDISVEGANSQKMKDISVQVNDELPPQILSESNTVVADPAGRILWAAAVNGDTSGTRLYTQGEGGDWELALSVPDKVEGGFVIPETAVAIKTVYEMDDLSNEAIYSVSRIPSALWEGLEVVRTFEDSILTDQMGVFLKTNNFPWMQHSELGWMYVYPLAGGIVFWGQIDEGGFGWNWMTADYFPFIYNYRTASWKYYWMNSYGWFQDYTTREWYKIGE